MSTVHLPATAHSLLAMLCAASAGAGVSSGDVRRDARRRDAYFMLATMPKRLTWLGDVRAPSTTLCSTSYRFANVSTTLEPHRLRWPSIL
jgi:hypothetical protein